MTTLLIIITNAFCLISNESVQLSLLEVILPRIIESLQWRAIRLKTRFFSPSDSIDLISDAQTDRWLEKVYIFKNLQFSNLQNCVLGIFSEERRPTAFARDAELISNADNNSNDDELSATFDHPQEKINW